MPEESPIAPKSGDLLWREDGKQAGQTIMRLRGENREMRNFLLRLNSARIAMNNEEVKNTLAEIGSWFKAAEKE